MLLKRFNLSLVAIDFIRFGMRNSEPATRLPIPPPLRGERWRGFHARNGTRALVNLLRSRGVAVSTTRPAPTPPA